LALATHDRAQRASAVAPSCSFTAATKVRTTACGLAFWDGSGMARCSGRGASTAQTTKPTVTVPRQKEAIDARDRVGGSSLLQFWEGH
jgi:hypothetical protein